MTRRRITDVIIAGSVRTEHGREVMTIICGQCGAVFDADTSSRTKRCHQCGRVCRFTCQRDAGSS